MNANIFAAKKEKLSPSQSKAIIPKEGKSQNIRGIESICWTQIISPRFINLQETSNTAVNAAEVTSEVIDKPREASKAIYLGGKEAPEYSIPSI